MANFYQVAKDMELEGKKFYENLSKESEVKELKGVFDFLALQEEVHYYAFSRMEGNEEVSIEDKKNAVKEAREIFSKIAPDFSAPAELNTAAETYKKALELEKNAVKYYTELLSSAETEDQKNVLKHIISEEESHVQVLEALIDFVNRPNEYLEDAEFTHLETY